MSAPISRLTTLWRPVFLVNSRQRLVLATLKAYLFSRSYEASLLTRSWWRKDMTVNLLQSYMQVVLLRLYHWEVAPTFKNKVTSLKISTFQASMQKSTTGRYWLVFLILCTGRGSHGKINRLLGIKYKYSNLLS